MRIRRLGDAALIPPLYLAALLIAPWMFLFYYFGLWLDRLTGYRRD